MKKATKILFLGSLSAVLAGCTYPELEVQRHNQQFLATLPAPNAYYAPLPKDYKQQMLSYLNRTLKDPESARYSDHTVRKIFITPIRYPYYSYKLSDKDVRYGQEVCMLVNAKNSYGGYAGNQLYWFFFEDGKLTKTYDTNLTSYPRDYTVGQDDRICPDFY